MPDDWMAGNVEERLLWSEYVVALGVCKALTLGKSKDNGLNLVPREGPPTYFSGELTISVYPSMELTRMTALVEAEEVFPLRVGTLSILARFQRLSPGCQVLCGECEGIGEFVELFSA